MEMTAAELAVHADGKVAPSEADALALFRELIEG